MLLLKHPQGAEQVDGKFYGLPSWLRGEICTLRHYGVKKRNSLLGLLRAETLRQIHRGTVGQPAVTLIGAKRRIWLARAHAG